MSQEYKKAHERYRQAVAQHSKGLSLDGKPLEGRSDKAKVMNEIRDMERAAARDGKIMTAIYKGDQVVVNVTETSTKRSLQEQYVRGFDNEAAVKLGNANQETTEQTLREYHAKRLGVRA